MKRALCLITAIMALFVDSCSDSSMYDAMPSDIQKFVSQYYPNTKIESYSSSANSYTVILQDGPTMVFDKQCQWTSIDGNGSVLPQVLLFNDFPPELYSYLQETQNTNSVFKVSRSSKEYTVQLLNSSIVYDVVTDQIQGLN